MSIFLISLGIFLLFLAYKLNKFKREMEKLQPGNIWESKSGETIIIESIGDVEDKFLLKCIKNGKYTSYNTLGEEEFTPTNKMHKHIGNRKTHPEYWLW